jgi:hypothetical protein
VDLKYQTSIKASPMAADVQSYTPYKWPVLKVSGVAQKMKVEALQAA